MPDGKVCEAKSFETTPLDIAKDISSQLAKKVLVAKVKYESRVATLDEGVVQTEEEEQECEEDWMLYDLFRPLEGDCHLQLFTFADDEGKHAFWHSSSHILGQVMECEFGVHLCYGPATTDGFYYDAHCGKDKFTEEHYGSMIKKAESIVKAKQEFKRMVITKEQALAMFAYNPFKTHLINAKIADGGKATAYRCGHLIDLCTGPHIPNTGLVKAFRVMKNSSSYWLGKASNDPLQRVYGVSFPSKKEMAEHLEFLKQAEERDHRKIGTEQQLWMQHKYSPGSWFFTREGTQIYNGLIHFVQHQYMLRGFQEVVTPNIYNLRLWKISGHYMKYKENMFIIYDKADCCGYGVKPMNCPGHMLMFASQSRSYKDLPIRYADFGVLHRNELSGALGGLTRVRRFQ